MSGYTVVDVETTGLSPERGDRVVEIGVVYVSDGGEIQDHWSTVINPQRDVGPTRIHGLTATDVAAAPTFSDLAPYVLRAISGRTTVAHNATFDLRFLASELLRSGVPLTDLPLSGVCTMQWSTAYLNASSRRLADCCRAGGVTLTAAHSAGADAMATTPSSEWRAAAIFALPEPTSGSIASSPRCLAPRTLESTLTWPLWKWR